MISKGAQIYYLTPEEKNLYLKDSFALWPEVMEVSGPIGNQFMDILKNFKDE
jgi:hypothetical protein